MGIFKSLFKSYSEKQINKIMPIVNKIEALGEKYAAMTDEELRGCTDIFKSRLSAGEMLNDILPDAFALVREADTRVLGKRPYRVQLMGGIILHQGRIAEMKTGEGKTLVETLPAYLNALSGNGVHIVTVNEYLAKRDSENMGRVFKFLGLTVGLIMHGMTPAEKKAAYSCDITYGMNNEFGFDYLRDNLAKDKEDLVCPGYRFAIVDEVDSILIDEARTPLIISAPSEKATHLYLKTDKLVRNMRAKVLVDTDAKEDYNSFEEHFSCDEASGSYALRRDRTDIFLSTFKLDAAEDCISTADYGIAVTESGRSKLISGFGFTEGDFVMPEDLEEYYFTDLGKRRAEQLLNRVIISEGAAGNGVLTEHGRDKLIKFFKFTPAMFIKNGEGYSLITKAKSLAMEELDLSEKDFSVFEKNFVINQKAKTASFLDVGIQNAKEFFSFTDDDFSSTPGGVDYTLTESGAEKLMGLFKLTQKELAPGPGKTYYIKSQAINRIKEYFARDMITDDRAESTSLTTVAAKKLTRFFSLEERDFIVHSETSTASLTPSAYKKIRESYALGSKHFATSADAAGCNAISASGKQFFLQYTELTDNSFIRSGILNSFLLSEDGISAIKRTFSLSSSDMLITPKAAYLTEFGAKKICEAYDLGVKNLILIDKNSGYYTLGNAAAEEIAERLGLSGEGFVKYIGKSGLYLGENVVSELKRNITLVENADFIYAPKVALITDEGKEKLISFFALDKNGLIESGDKTYLTKSAAKIFKRILALDELYSPLLLTKGGIEKMSNAINFDYIVSEKRRTSSLTKIGIEKAERYFEITNIADEKNAEILHHLNIAVSAYGSYKEDVHYVVKNKKVYIVDQSTGRILEGRRFSDGLHQAIEAKANVEIKRETLTVATVSVQNFFRLYKKLSGMTGTALTEENEFREIYSLDVVAVPTNRPMIRTDHNDVMFSTRSGKLNAILAQIIDCYKKRQPVLVGTTSVEKSEELSKLLAREKIPHKVLNAKEHQNEATIIAEAGMPGAVTIATNMAGRGTDIMLGGNPEIFAKNKLKQKLHAAKRFAGKGEAYLEYLLQNADATTDTDNEDIIFARNEYNVILDKCIEETIPKREEVIKAGGLFVIGTERHDSRRIDNQLAGRSGRQGDVGESRFYISLEDDLVRQWGPQSNNILARIGLQENVPLTMNLLTTVVKKAQGAVEARNFAARKSVLEYDDVMNEQRNVIYQLRRDILLLSDEETDLKMKDIVSRAIGDRFDLCANFDEGTFDYMEFSDIFGAAMALSYGDDVQSEATSSAEYSDDFSEDITDGELSIPEGKVKLDLEAERKRLCDTALDIYDSKERAAGLLSVKSNTVIINEDSEEYKLLCQVPTAALRGYRKNIWLSVIEKEWIDHLEQMQDLKNYIGLNSFAQRNPIVEYKLEGAEMFGDMMRRIRERVTKAFLNMKPTPELLMNTREAQRILGNVTRSIASKATPKGDK